MPARRPLPPELMGCVFTVRQAVDLGVPRPRLNASDIRRLGPGLYAQGVDEPSEIAQAAALRYWRPDLWLSHASAARFHGLWVPRRIVEDRRLHVALPRRSAPIRAGGIVGHLVSSRPGEVWTGGPVPAAPPGVVGAVASPGRTWFDLAADLSLDDLVALGDQVVRRPYPRFDGRRDPWNTTSGLASLLTAHPGAAGVGRAKAALVEVRVGSDSVQETRLRLAIVRAGLPEPELQLKLDPRDRFSAGADMGYRASRIAMHYEGDHHRSADQLKRDLRRNELFAANGWANYHFTSDDARQGFDRAVVLLRQVFGVSARRRTGG